MNERSLLRVRPRPHIDPNRDQGEFVVEVWRGGEVVATIYGTREGVQILSNRFALEPVINKPFGITVNDAPSIIVPLLAIGEECPWCQGAGIVLGAACPVCNPSHTAAARRTLPG